MKSVRWPIHWKYEGDKDKGKEFHGEGRAVLGALKNMTYGGANLGQNRLVKKYAGGVEIVAEILPGIDKVTIYVPPTAGGEKEIEAYFPYLWVGARISDGGLWDGAIPEESNYKFDMILLLHVWDVPPSDSGDGWTVDDPNEVQLVSSARDQGAFSQGADIFPMQYEALPYGAAYVGQDPSEQRFVHRIDAWKGGVVNNTDDTGWWLGNPHTYYLQYTKNGLMMPLGLDPYDPEYNPDDPNPDKIWASTAWLDPWVSKYERKKSAPMKTARDTFGPYDIDGVEFEVPGKQVGGKFVAKVSIIATSECDNWSRPLKVEVEMRIGKPWVRAENGQIAQGKSVRIKKEVEVIADPVHAVAFRNFLPYGYYDFNHEIEIQDGWVTWEGPGTDNTMWWEGALIGDMMGGNVAYIENFNFSGDDKDDYTIHNEFLGGNRYAEPVFGDNPPAIDQCFESTCDGTFPIPVHETLVAGEPWVKIVNLGSSGPFDYSQPYASYLLGRLATVVCGTFNNEGILFSAVVQINDPDAPNYNGEVWPCSPYADYRNFVIGEQVIIREPWYRGAPNFNAIPVAELGGDIAVYHAAAIRFDEENNPPPDY